MNKQLEHILQRVASWPKSVQDELARIVAEMEQEFLACYRPSEEELQAIDEADAGGIASQAEVTEAFRSFRF